MAIEGSLPFNAVTGLTQAEQGVRLNLWLCHKYSANESLCPVVDLELVLHPWSEEDISLRLQAHYSCITSRTAIHGCRNLIRPCPRHVRKVDARCEDARLSTLVTSVCFGIPQFCLHYGARSIALDRHVSILCRRRSYHASYVPPLEDNDTSKIVRVI